MLVDWFVKIDKKKICKIFKETERKMISGTMIKKVDLVKIKEKNFLKDYSCCWMLYNKKKTNKHRR